MNFTLNILGTASALPIVNRHPSAQVLDVRGRLFLIDCGEGVQEMIRKMHLSFLKISEIFITHLHGDHFFGIFGLLSTLGMLGRTGELHIYGPAPLRKVLDDFLKYFGEGLKYDIHVHELGMKEPEVIMQTKSLEVYAFPLNHRIEAFGYMFKEKMPVPNIRKDELEKYSLTLSEIARLKRGEDIGRDGEVLKCEDLTYVPYQPRSYAYCSDTAPFPELAGWIKGVDLLYHETTFPEQLTQKAAETFHSTTIQAAECARDAGVGKLLIGHYSSRFQDLNIFLDEVKSVFPEAELTDDGMIVELPLKKCYI